MGRSITERKEIWEGRDKERKGIWDTGRKGKGREEIDQGEKRMMGKGEKKQHDISGSM